MDVFRISYIFILPLLLCYKIFAYILFFICCLNYFVLILNLFILVDGPYQVDPAQEDHPDAHQEDQVHIGQACPGTSGGGSEEPGGGTTCGGTHGGTSGGLVGGSDG